MLNKNIGNRAIEHKRQSIDIEVASMNKYVVHRSAGRKSKLVQRKVSKHAFSLLFCAFYARIGRIVALSLSRCRLCAIHWLCRWLNVQSVDVHQKISGVLVIHGSFFWRSQGRDQFVPELALFTFVVARPLDVGLVREEGDHLFGHEAFVDWFQQDRHHDVSAKRLRA